MSGISKIIDASGRVYEAADPESAIAAMSDAELAELIDELTMDDPTTTRQWDASWDVVLTVAINVVLWRFRERARHEASGETLFTGGRN